MTPLSKVFAPAGRTEEELGNAPGVRGRIRGEAEWEREPIGEEESWKEGKGGVLVGKVGPGFCGRQASLRNGKKASGARVGLSMPGKNETERVYPCLGVLQIWAPASP